MSIILLAGPQRPLSQGTQRVLTNIELVLDVSGMTAQYGDGKRADKAVEALQEFVSHRKGDAFGVTLFGTEVLHWVTAYEDSTLPRHSAPFMKLEAMPPYMGVRGSASHAVGSQDSRRPAKGRQNDCPDLRRLSGDLRGQSDKISSDLNGDDIVLYYIHVANGQPQQEVYDIANRTGGEAFVAGDPRRCRRYSRKSTPCNRPSSSRRPQSRRTTSGIRTGRPLHCPATAHPVRHKIHAMVIFENR